MKLLHRTFECRHTVSNGAGTGDLADLEDKEASSQENFYHYKNTY